MRIPVIAFFILALTGCTLSNTTSPTAEPGLSIQGNVHGGQQPIVGARVYLLAANNTGYGGNGIAPSTANASISLLNAATTAQSDTIGAYVLTAADGSFSITSDYTCTPGQQVYLYALGGNPGAGTNSAAGLMNVVGACPAAGTFSSSSFYWINEVTTVAAAYALAGFTSDATHVSSSGTALAHTAIATAFANAINLVNPSNGQALAITPAGNGTVPQSEINTLANILAACVNSTGTVTGPTNPSSCYTLFNNAESGGSSGIMPSDTATAAINIAHNPTANMANLYGLVPATAAFQPTLATKPKDWTVRLIFGGGGLNIPSEIAIDGSGNAWIICRETNSVAEFSALGAVVSGPNGYSFGGLYAATALALDQFGNAWVEGNGSIFKFSSTGTLLSGTNGYPVANVGLNGDSGMAIDGSGNVWIAIFTNSGIIKLSNSGVVLASINYPAGGLNGPDGIAIDGSGNVWTSNFESGISEFTSAGAPITNSNGYIGSGLNVPQAIALDGSGDVWVASEYDDVSEFTNAGVPLTGTNGLYGGGLNYPSSVAIDGSGNAWFLNGNNSVTEFSSVRTALSGSGYALAPQTIGAGGGGVAVDGSGNLWAVTGNTTNVTEIIGVATPVITPIAAGLPPTPTASGSSYLGTRP